MESLNPAWDGDLFALCNLSPIATPLQIVQLQQRPRKCILEGVEQAYVYAHWQAFMQAHPDGRLTPQEVSRRIWEYPLDLRYFHSDQPGHIDHWPEDDEPLTCFVSFLSFSVRRLPTCSTPWVKGRRYEE